MKNFEPTARARARTEMHPWEKWPRDEGTALPRAQFSSKFRSPPGYGTLVGFREGWKVRNLHKFTDTRGQSPPHPAVYVASDRTLLGEVCRILLPN